MRFHKTHSFGRTVRHAAQRGQSIIVALLVLLLLGLAGALFVTIIARNLINARRASRTISADQYARAGITFADAQLSNSLDGADWRPPLQFKLSVQPNEVRELGRYMAATTNLGAPDPNDPDLKYLEAGFTRYNTGAGRFLLRLTYTPVLQKDASGQFYDPVIGKDNTGAAIAPVVVPPGKYIKIEAIGREGIIEPLDPTTFTNNRSSDKLQAYQVAYKPIGITDYARFETNIDNRSDTANLGVNSRFNQQDTDGQIGTPGVYDFNSVSGSVVTFQQYPVLTTYGAADAYQVIGNSLVPNPQAGTNTKIDKTKFLAGGGSIHANMPVRFFGKNIVYLNDAMFDAPLYQDGVEVAGDLLLNGYQSAIKLDNSNSATVGNGQSGQRTALILNPPDLAKLKTNGTDGTYIVPSNDNNSVDGAFSTQKGLIRDGANGNDNNGSPRGIGRVEPPLMDAVESATRIPRYKALAMMSPPRIDPSTGKAYVGVAGGPSPSQYGYGQSIYINNAQDIQENSKSVGGGSTLVDQWLNRTAPKTGNNKGGWTRGDFYDPPGVNITLGRQTNMTASGKSAFGVRLALFADDPKTPVAWPNPDGSVGTETTKTVLFDDINASNDPAKSTGVNPDNDVIIYAEGNIRVHGLASADPADLDKTLNPEDKYPRHITLVTNGTAYIEGSVLKGNPDSSITILAHDYVCVNTTQFLAGPILDNSALGASPAGGGDEDFHALTFGSDETTLIQELNFGLPNGGNPFKAYGSNLLGLYVSGRPGDTGGTQADFEIVNPVTGMTLANTVPFTPGSPPTATLTFDPTSLKFNQQYFDLSGFADNSMNPTTNLNQLVESNTRLLEVRRSISAPQDLQLERVAVLPMDVRIEAILYAQTGSFFVIPGLWFNSSSTDSLDVFAPTVTTTTPMGMRSSSADPHFPFYGQPIDMKIIIDGAVSEAQPADVANQTAWMLKWGWIPQYHGFTGASPEPAGHQLAGKPAVGLQIIYNPQAGYPYNPGDTTASPIILPHYLRSDAYGRPLPFSPKLPVSTGLLYAGESSEPPLLQ